MKKYRSKELLERYELRAEPLLLVAALLFCVAFAWPIIDPNLRHSWREICALVDTVIWFIFLFDYLFRLLITPKRWIYVKRNLVDLLILVLPIFRPLRLIRLVYLLRLFNRTADGSLRGKVAWYACGSAVIIVLVGALAELDAERFSADATISDFPTALWWAITTVTTVGYGDTYPVTTEGRIVAIALMIYGIGLLATVTGMLASWLVNKVDEADEARDKDVRADIAALHKEIKELKATISALTPLAPNPEIEDGA